jgi:pyruvate,orthophosphate dikinase
VCCAAAAQIRRETSPEDVKGMYTAEGVLCQLGGMTSHAAVVARGWGKPCVTGCADLQVRHVDTQAGQHARMHAGVPPL